jgi:hypothetical protein
MRAIAASALSSSTETAAITSGGIAPNSASRFGAAMIGVYPKAYRVPW